MNRLAIQDRDKAIYIQATDPTFNTTVQELGYRYNLTVQHIRRIIKKEAAKQSGKCWCCGEIANRLYPVTLDERYGEVDMCHSCSLARTRGGK